MRDLRDVATARRRRRTTDVKPTEPHFCVFDDVYVIV